MIYRNEFTIESEANSEGQVCWVRSNTTVHFEVTLKIFCALIDKHQLIEPAVKSAINAANAFIILYNKEMDER